MAAVQTSYADGLRAGLPGMIVNAESANTITRTADAGIGFGLPVIRTGDHTCILATQETLESAAPVASAGNTGNGTFAATPTISAGAKEGTYRVEITAEAADAGTFAVEDPEGNLVGYGTVGVAFSDGGVAFTLNDGATDFDVDDSFTFAVAPSEATADLDLLGISVRDPSLDVSNADAYEQYDNVAIMERGVMWVTAGATVAAGQLAYWNPATSRYTVTATHLPVTINGRRAKFDSASTDGNIVKLAVR